MASFEYTFENMCVQRVKILLRDKNYKIKWEKKLRINDQKKPKTITKKPGGIGIA